VRSNAAPVLYAGRTAVTIPGTTAVVPQHLVEKIPVSQVCEKHSPDGLLPLAEGVLRQGHHRL